MTCLVVLGLFLCCCHYLCFASTIGPEPYLVFGTWFTVSRMNLDGSNYSVLVDSTTNSGIHAVDYHLRLNKLFWTHYRDGSINQANMDGSQPTEIVSNVTRPSGLAVDWMNDRVYYSFGDFGSLTVNPNHLAVYDMSTGTTTEITAVIDQTHAVFHDIAVDPLQRKLYWATGSALVQSSLSGEGAEVVFNPSCNTRYLGLRSNLYWTEDCGSDESVHSLDLTTLQESVIVTTDANSFYSDVTSYEDTVYWTALGRVNSAPATADSSATELLHISSIATNFRGIVVVHPDLQPCPSPESYLLFSTWFTVSRMNLDGSNYTVLVDSSDNVGPQAVDYHFCMNKFFWTHYRDGTIHQANIDGSNPKVLVSNVTRPSALAVDWVNNKVYFSFGDHGSNLVYPNHLAYYDLATSAVTDITSAINTNALFHDLAVDPDSQKLYWTTGSALVQSSLSGEDAEVVFSPSCNARYLGLRSNLYWTEDCGSDESIHSLDLTTLQESVIVTTDANSFYSDVASYEDTVYWTALGRVNSAPATADSSATELLHISSISTNFRGIVVVHPDLQPRYEITPTSSLHPKLKQSPSPMSSYNGISSTPTDTTFRSSHLQSQPSPSPMSSEDESSASSEIIVPLAAGLTVTATIIAIVLLVSIAFGVVFFVKNKSKRESTALSSGDMYITTSPNTVYKAFERHTSDKATAEFNDDDCEKMDPAETVVTTDNIDQQLYEEIDESVIFNSNDSQYDN